jgi:polyphosphate glucokinase
MSEVIGVDIGGSAIKIGAVNPKNGKVTNRVSIDTPKNSTPEFTLNLIKKNLPENYKAVGFGIPCIIKNGVTRTAPNIGPAWNNVEFQKLAEDILGVRCSAMNDADAAALAEIRFGVMKDLFGVTIFLTLGTGIGTAIHNHGRLLLNTEFGRMALPGGIDDAEMIASAKAKANKKLSWEEYSENVNIYLAELNKLFWPDHVVIGGGVSDSWYEWGHLLKAPFQIHKAHLGNNAGIIGSALSVF